MKRITIALFVTVVSLMLTSCFKIKEYTDKLGLTKGKETEQTDKQPTAIDSSKVEDYNIQLPDDQNDGQQSEMDDEDTDEPTSSVLPTVRNQWKDNTVEVPGQGRVGIRQFAEAIAKAYSAYPANAAILADSKGQKEYKTPDGLTYSVRYNEMKGYADASVDTQFDLTTKVCYWFRKDGKQLVGAWMRESHESEKEQNALLFYLYDAESRTLIPQPNIAEMIIRPAKGYDDYMVVLPEDGKDIELRIYKSSDADSYSDIVKTFRWNGTSFDLKN